MPFLRRLSCAQSPPFLFLGAINWAAVVPRAAGVGIRLDRCGFAWDLGGALANFGKSFKAWGGGEACDRQGAVLPVPYAIGAGYIFSAALLQWVATSRSPRGKHDIGTRSERGSRQLTQYPLESSRISPACKRCPNSWPRRSWAGRRWACRP